MEAIVAGLKDAVPFAEKAKVTLTIEAINPYDHPKDLFYDCDQLAGMIRKVNHPRVRALWDFYHLQRSTGELIGNFTKHRDIIEHIHVGDVPGRLQPGTGEINYPNIYRVIKKSGYDGRIALECFPTVSTKEALVDVKRTFDEALRI
jgi:hydroxypyruvate isomerase